MNCIYEPLDELDLAHEPLDALDLAHYLFCFFARTGQSKNYTSNYPNHAVAILDRLH